MILRVREQDLGRDAAKVIREVQMGNPAVIESGGVDEAVILDITDYRILRSVLRHYTANTSGDGAESKVDLESIENRDGEDQLDAQNRYDLAMASYLGGSISLGRAAETLEIPWIELRARLARLGVPMEFAPASEAEAISDADIAINVAPR